ncbi:MAG: lipoate--protein ligase family protein [Chloroflexota bacterium]
MTERWTTLAFDVGPASEHFARSNRLVREVVEPSVWWHKASQPALILGVGQQTSIDLQTCRALEIEVVRRQAGGTAILAQPDVLGLDVALPPDHILVRGDIVEAYRWLGETWGGALRKLGIDARVISVAEARLTSFDSADILRAACFGSLSPYEVAVAGKKLVGMAQVRRKTGVLLQSAVHRRFDSTMLARLLGGGRDLEAQLDAAATGLDDVTSEAPTDEAVIAAFAESLYEQFNIELIC